MTRPPFKFKPDQIVIIKHNHSADFGSFLGQKAKVKQGVFLSFTPERSYNHYFVYLIRDRDQIECCWAREDDLELAGDE